MLACYVDSVLALQDTGQHAGLFTLCLLATSHLGNSLLICCPTEFLDCLHVQSH